MNNLPTSHTFKNIHLAIVIGDDMKTNIFFQANKYYISYFKTFLFMLGHQQQISQKIMDHYQVNLLYMIK